jgi:ribosomal protein S18 acetylase RimI-like enzyme
MNVRHPSMDELEAAANVLNEHSRALRGTDDMTPAELEVVWRSPELDFPANVFVAERDGRLVGYADVSPFGSSAWVDARATDIDAYDPLLDVALPHAERQAKQHVRAFAGDEDQAAVAALRRFGFEPIRYGFRMMIELDRDLPEADWPPGFSVRPFQAGDERRFHEAHEQSFADTWEFTPEPFEDWSHWFMSPPFFAPEHWLAVESSDGDLAAVAMCRISDTIEDSGWIRILGVLPAYRRRGLARALLHHVFRHFAALGLKRVGLGVDAESPTGAVALYEGAGMHVAWRNVTLERVPG